MRMGRKRNVLTFLKYKLGFVLILAALCYPKPTRANTKPTAERKVDASEIPGFISIDCGVAEDYNDTSLRLLYRSDAGFIDSGINYNISAQHLEDTNWRGTNLRSFPNGKRNCYTIWPENATNNDYIIRAGFMYGNYDNRSRVPYFDLYIGIDKWVTVNADNSSNYFYYEIIHGLNTDYVDICLVNTGHGVPFISYLELRPLRKRLYGTDFGSLRCTRRNNLGASTPHDVGYPDDVYDRRWKPANLSGSEPLSFGATHKIKSDGDTYKLPKKVLETALQPSSDPCLIYYYEPENVTEQYLFYLHFADLVQHENGELRKLDINVNDESYARNVALEYLKPKTIPLPSPISAAAFTICIRATGNSMLPPILNALEIFHVMRLNSTPTAFDDVVAMKAIKKTYALTRNWQGDPCLPTDYRWEGIDCSYDYPPTITSLNLSSSGLKVGNIAASMSKLAALKSLNLSNNKLSGQLPESLAEMSSLEVLDISKNRLSGQLPEFLAEIPRLRVLNLSDNNFTVQFRRPLKKSGEMENWYSAGNPGLPWSGKSERKNSVSAIAASSTVALLVLIVIGAILIFWTKKRKTRMKFQRPEIRTKTTTRELLLPKGRQFSYSELLRITNHFSTVVGEGGFGNVYYGILDGATLVAVKLLSQSSKQGYREFRAEAQLLLMVHHRNLVSLLGYCIDGETMALIYEYMANGNLQQHLSDKNANILQWHQRLQIAIDAAQGLEYLHNGCIPPIVHRDVKPSNILLDEKMQAKIADFGLSRAFDHESTSHVSTGLAGTLGYLAPEVQNYGNFSKKTDVYSFGIVLLELITGQPALLKRPTGNIHLPQWITPIIERGDIRYVVDPRLQGNFDHNSAWKAVEIAMSCVPLSAMERPNIGQILIELKECLAIHLMTHEGSQSITLDSEVPEAIGSKDKNRTEEVAAL